MFLPAHLGLTISAGAPRAYDTIRPADILPLQHVDVGERVPVLCLNSCWTTSENKQKKKKTCIISPVPQFLSLVGEPGHLVPQPRDIRLVPFLPNPLDFGPFRKKQKEAAGVPDRWRKA